MLVDFSIINKLTFMRELSITPNEYELIIALCMAQREDVEDTAVHKTEMDKPSHISSAEYLITLQNLIGRVPLRELLHTLQDKGIILKSVKLPEPNSTESFSVNLIKFNKQIMKKYLRHSGEMFWELFWEYPESGFINGRLQSLRNLAGNGGGWSNIDEAATFYGQRIQFNAQTHEMILDLIRRGKEQDLISMGLVKFLRGEEWRTLSQMLENQIDLKFV